MSDKCIDPRELKNRRKALWKVGRLQSGDGDEKQLEREKRGVYNFKMKTGSVCFSGADAFCFGVSNEGGLQI